MSLNVPLVSFVSLYCFDTKLWRRKRSAIKHMTSQTYERMFEHLVFPDLFSTSNHRSTPKLGVFNS